jgi:hypothetical protein
VPAGCNVHLKGIALEVTPLRYGYVWHTCKPCNVPVTLKHQVVAWSFCQVQP